MFDSIIDASDGLTLHLAWTSANGWISIVCRLRKKD